MDTIEVGDIVNIYFNTADAIFEAEIIRKPVATGDCFSLKGKDGHLYNVQQFNYMVTV